MTILLLDIPGLNPAYLGCYGNDWVATPNLDRLAAEGVVFDGHYAGTRDDLRTGRYSFPGTTRQAQVTPPAYTGSSLVHVVAAECESTPLDEQFSQLLKSIINELKKKSRPEKLVLCAEFPDLAPPWNLPLEMLNAYCDEQTKADEDAELDPWPDPPAKLPPGDDDSFDRLQFTYAAVVTFVDAQLGWLIDKLNQKGLLNQLLLIITSSRGLPLGEHGWIGRQRAWQHEESAHLPLLMRLPQAEEGGLRIGALTQPVDVMPTLLDYLDLPPASLPGLSLRPLIRHEATELRSQAFSGDCIGDSVEWSLRTSEWAYLLPISSPEDDLPRSPRLYVKPDDRWEVNDVSAHHPELVEQLDGALRAFVALDEKEGV